MFLSLNNHSIELETNHKTMGKRYNQSDNSKYSQFDDDFEDFGYEVKNIRRQTKKKVAKFKREVNEYDDTY